ncbi:MAG: hypothetical protein HC906_03250 [Bacteroidales bacterium]|nr:hypothetical protein [Bacteroidales bacterium]
MITLTDEMVSNLAVRLQRIYREKFSESLVNKILRLILDCEVVSASTSENGMRKMLY